MEWSIVRSHVFSFNILVFSVFSIAVRDDPQTKHVYNGHAISDVLFFYFFHALDRMESCLPSLTAITAIRRCYPYERSLPPLPHVRPVRVIVPTPLLA